MTMRKISRRDLMRTSLAAAAGVTLLEATPEVIETDTRGEGPYYKPNAPVRSVFTEDGMPGVRFHLTGRVLRTDAKPMAGALLDLWHANHEGLYDNEGYRLRGRLYTDADGRFDLRTIMPKEYAQRAAHIHCKVSAAECKGITTELYFKGNRANSIDHAVSEKLMLNPRDAKLGKEAAFDFVLKPEGNS